MSSNIEPSTPKKYDVPVILRDLVHLTIRLFYEPKYIILMDMLAEERV